MTLQVHVRGVDLTVEVGGDGPDVVWGHGLTSSMAQEDEVGLVDWAPIRRSRRVVRYDARGHGSSGDATDPTDLSWHALSLDQLALADALGIDRYVAGGASMGCATALHAAVAAPDRITGLVLAIPPTGWAMRSAQTSAYATMADLVDAGDHDTLLRGAAARPRPDPFVDDPTWDDRFPQLVATTPPGRVAAMFRGAGTADLPEPDAIAGLRVPTLILAWTGDPGHPVQTAARLQELMPHAELVLATTPAGLAAWTERVGRFLQA